MSKRRIENDEAYDRSLAWLVNKARELDDPLIDPKRKAELMSKYDYVADAVQRYRRGQMVKTFPGLREQYVALGWEFDEPDPDEFSPTETPTPPETASTAAEPPPQPKPAAALAGWLDDD